MTAVAVTLGLGLAAGVLLVIDGLRRPPPPEGTTTKSSPLMAAGPERFWSAVGAAGAVLVVTRWPVAAVGAGLLGWFARDLLGGQAARQAGMARTEAIAAWTEMLRDTINAAHGLEAAITATAQVAPGPIRSEVTALARRIEREPLPEALARLADDLAHPIADLVAAALSVAASGSTRDLADLLGTLAAAARDEAAMQLRVEAARARTRTAVRVIAAVTVATVVLLIVLNPLYVEVYGTATGQVVLAGILSCWGGALWWLARMSQFRHPDRFLVSPAGAGR
jgi:Flp pilus assembly protein TadB